MARIRSVSPDLCTSEKMAGLPASAERTFVRLWTHCDDEGRWLDNPRLLKAALYPLVDEVTIEVLDDELELLFASNLIVRYEIDGRAFGAVVSWDEYQHPQKPSKSKLPAPSSTATRPVRARRLYPYSDDGDTAPVGVGGASRTEWSGVGGGERIDSNGTRQPDPAPEPAEPIPPIDQSVYQHRWADNVTTDEVIESLFVLRNEHIPDEFLLEALTSSDPFPSKWRTRARELHRAAQATRAAERRERPACPDCGTSGFVLDDQGDAVPCPNDQHARAEATA